MEVVKDYVVVRDGDDGTWRSAPMEPEGRQVMEEVQRGRRVVDKDRKSPVGEQAWCVPEWLETSMDVVVVVPESVEEALTLEEVMHRLMVLKLVVLMSVVGWTPEVAAHEKHEGPLHGVDCLHHEGHGPRR